MSSTSDNFDLEQYCNEIDLRITEQQARDLGWTYEDKQRKPVGRTTVWKVCYASLLALFAFILICAGT
ncbi:hypothetical protein [Vibrio sp. TBV020]|uniref:hypothetical protein n=1 Tax=Vibrio sp. TBV020 TaxID=3137398 RepID=UPI0038CD85E9